MDKRFKTNLRVYDETNTNVGWKSGVIKRLQENLERPLHWIICQLHSHELSLGHLLIHFDGKTSEPRQFTSPIRKLLHDKDFK